MIVYFVYAFDGEYAKLLPSHVNWWVLYSSIFDVLLLHTHLELEAMIKPINVMSCYLDCHCMYADVMPHSLYQLFDVERLLTAL